ncbi:MAG TPA: hotdog fold thioesterase [Anaerolineales bacterium]|nr:hotdog fold thioesterase [Anaerolineales bacterium]
MAFPKDEGQWLAGFDRIHKNTAVEFFDITLDAIDDDKIELLMPIRDKTRQPFGLLHGGVSMMLAETAASVHATWGIDVSEKVPVGIEINGSHVRSASEGAVRAVGRVVRRSRSMVVHLVEIIHEDTGKMLCSARVTNYYKPLRKEEE